MTQNHVFGEGPKKLLLLASTGGHLTQLKRLAPQHGASVDSLWVTFENDQSRSLLKQDNVMWVDYIPPRGVFGALKTLIILTRTLKGHEFDGVLSTGAAIAIPGFIWARFRQIDSVYIESCSRSQGPSLTGKMTSKLNLAKTYTQHRTWSSKKWPLTDSVMSTYLQVARQSEGNSDRNKGRKIFVTLGTIRPYRFDRLVDRLLQVIQPTDSLIWQLGVTSRSDLPGAVHSYMSNELFEKTAKEADVVITHAGMGTVLQLMDAGISPVVVPRRKEHAEHVDNHQLQLWSLLGDIDVCVPVEVDGLMSDHLDKAQNSIIIEKAQ